MRFVPLFLLLLAIIGCSPPGGDNAGGDNAGATSAKQTPDGDSSARPNRPKQAILGHWQAHLKAATYSDGTTEQPNGEKHGYFRIGGKGVLVTLTFPDGSIEEEEYFVKSENTTRNEVVLQRWFNDQETGGKGEKLAKYSDGSDMIQTWKFDDDKMKVTETRRQFDGSEREIHVWSYIDATTQP
jgi:hypothetical protein